MFPLSPNFPSRRPFYHNRRELGSSEELLLGTMLPRGLALFWGVVATLKGLFFTMAAYLQHNDPDPHLWIPVYAVSAVASFHLAFRCYRHVQNGVLPAPPRWTCPLLLTHLAYSTLLAIHTLFLASEEGRERSPTSGQLMVLEEAKEVLGLAIVAAWSSLLLSDNFARMERNKSVLAGCLISAAPLLAWILIGDEAQYCQ